MSKPATVLSTDTFLTWRTRFNSLLSLACEVVESTAVPNPATDDSSLYENGTLWIRTTDDTAYVLVDNTDTAAIWIQLGATPGALKDDGTVPLTADWDAGSWQIRAETFQSDVTTGTAPFTVASTTQVTGLNAQYLSNNAASEFNKVDSDTSSEPDNTIDHLPVGTIFVVTNTDKAFVCVDNAADAAVWTELGAVTGALLAGGTVPLTADWDAGSWNIRAETFQADVATGTPPLYISSTTVVSNLNVSFLEGIAASGFLRTNGSTGLSTDWDAGQYQIKAQNVLEFDKTVKVASFTAAIGMAYAVDTDTGNAYGHGASASNVSVTAPASPAVGAQFGIFHVGDGDIATPAANESLTILRNSSNIMGVTDDLAVDVNNTNFRMTYVSSGWGWQVTIM
jgi:hypothetical protein